MLYRSFLKYLNCFPNQVEKQKRLKRIRQKRTQLEELILQVRSSLWCVCFEGIRGCAHAYLFSDTLVVSDKLGSCPSINPLKNTTLVSISLAYDREPLCDPVEFPEGQRVWEGSKISWLITSPWEKDSAITKFYLQSFSLNVPHHG